MANATGKSERASKVLDAMKAAGITHDGKATDADHVAKLARLPKGQVNDALRELTGKKLVRRIEHHKAARYVVQPPPAATPSP